MMRIIHGIAKSIVLVSISILVCLLFSLKLNASVLISGGVNATILAGNPYSTLSAAITALNAGGAITAPVILDVSAGHFETLSGRITMTVTGTASNPILIQKSGIGPNPKLVSFVGTNATASSIADGMFALVGCDYVTIDGINLQESSANTTPTTVMEFGFAFFKASATDGAQHNTIRNCNISLSRVQNTNWTTTGHSGSIGIVMNNTVNTSTTSITPTAISGSNSFNSFYSNTISNCNTGIALIGYPTFGSSNFVDEGNIIGGNSPTFGNTILNFGGAPLAANPAVGIFLSSQRSVNCSNNFVNNNDGGGVNHINALIGIQSYSAFHEDGNYNNNIIQIKGGGTTSQVSAMNIAVGGSTTVNINNNDITGSYLTTTTGIFYGIAINTTASNLNIQNNNVHDITINSQLTSGTGGFVYGIWSSGSSINTSVYNNIIQNIVGTGLSGYTTTALYCSSSTNPTIRKNNISNISIGGSGTFGFMQGINLITSSSAGIVICDSNLIQGLVNSKTSSNGDMYGITISGTPSSEVVFMNTISNLSNAGSGLTLGINSTSNTNNRVISNNLINSLNSASTTSVAGVYTLNGSPSILKNKIYDINGNSSVVNDVSGIMIGSGNNINAFNNLIGQIKAPFVGNSSPGKPTVRGVNIVSTTTLSSISLSNNSIFLNASSSGANFGSAGVFHQVAFNAPATTANLTMRNNLIYNTSVPSGTGLTVAYQRSSSNKANYNLLSNRNLFYAGTPSVNRLIFTDTVVFNQSLIDYKNAMLANGADQQSYDSVVVFQSTLGSSSDFLKFDTITPTYLESRGSSIPSLTDDYIGTIRAGNIGYNGFGFSSDIGAWELNGIPINGCSGIPMQSSTLVDNANPPCTTPNFTLSLDVTYNLGVVFQWEESSINASIGFSPILGATNSTLTLSASSLKWYRCAITCLVGSQSIYSTPIMAGPTPLSGAYLIDNTGIGQYLNFYQAITDLSCKGIIGPVVFNVSSGQIFNETNNLNCMYSGSALNTITFQKIGIGPNPIIRRTGTISDTDYVLKLSGVDYYTFNGINIEQSGTSASNYVERGIYITNLTNSDGAQYNTFKNAIISTTVSSPYSKGVRMDRNNLLATTEGTNSYNRFINLTVQNVMIGYDFNGITLNGRDVGNEINTEANGISLIQGIGNNLVDASVAGVYTSGQFNFILKNTEIKNVVSSSASIVNGISIGGDSLFISNNSIHDISVPVNLTGIAFNPLTFGTLSNNNVFNLFCNATGAGLNVKGIDADAVLSGTTDTALIRIGNNKVFHLQNSATNTATCIGITAKDGNPYLFNNMVSDLKASAAGNSGGVRGISLLSGQSNTHWKLYFNTVYLNDNSSNSQYTSAGIYVNSFEGQLDMRNNAIVNLSNVNNGGRAVGLMNQQANDIFDTLGNNNLWYAGYPDTKHLIYYDGTNSAQTITDFKLLSLITPAENNSVQEKVFFQPSANGNLRPSYIIPTRLESGGQPIIGLGFDFENDIRNSSTPDIGADEGNFIQGAANCNGAPSSSIAISNPMHPCPGTLFTLSTDVYFNLDYSFQWEESSISAASGYMPISGANTPSYSTSFSSNKWFRCVVTCITSGLSTASTPIYVNYIALSGNYLIDNTGAGDYISFYDAIADIDCKGIAGPVTFNVTAGQIFDELNELNLTYSASNINTITFKKIGTGANPSIRRSGSSGSTDYVLKVSGVDYYTFDGIDFVQNGTSNLNFVEYGIYLVNESTFNGAQNNTFKNGTVSLTNAISSSKGVYIQSTIIPSNLLGTNSNNQFINMTVQNAYEGYRFLGSSITLFDEGNQIKADTNGMPSAISKIQNIGNSSIATTPFGVFVEYQTNFSISSTEIMNVNSSATTTAGEGIRIGNTAANTASLSNNTIHDISGPGNVFGINVVSATYASVLNNRIYSLTSNASATNVVGVFSKGTSSFIGNNIIYNIVHTATLNASAIGIMVQTGIHTLYNNMISDLHASASSNSLGSIKGISINSGTIGAATRVYNNTIYLNDIGTNSNYSAAGIFNTTAASLFLDFRNNVVVNNANVTTGLRSVAFWKTSTVDNYDNTSDNNLWYAGVPGAKNLIYYNGTISLQTLASYKSNAAITPGEANAVTENVNFSPIINGVLRPSITTPTLIESGGQPLAIFQKDFENDIRSSSAPDRGADEGNFLVTTIAVPGCASNLSPLNNSTNICYSQAVSLDWGIPTSGGPVTLGYDVYFGTSSNPPFIANVNTLSYSINSLLPNTTYYWKVVAKNATGIATSCIINTFTTSDAHITSVIPGSVCGIGSISLQAIGTGNISWYDAPIGGNFLIGGNSFFVSPTSTTTYYVSANGGTTSFKGGKILPDPTAALTATLNSGLIFDATESFTLNSIDVYVGSPSALGFTISLQNSAGITLQSMTAVVPAGSGTSPKTVTLNFNIPVGTGYRLVSTSTSPPALTSELNVNDFPFALGNVGSITNGINTGVPTNSYFYFYNWKITSSTSCVSARVPVVATVIPAPPIQINPVGQSVCPNSGSTTYTASSSNAYTYSWNPGAFYSNSILVPNNGITTTYTVIGTDGTCTTSKTVVHTIYPMPHNLYASSNSPVCVGSSVQFQSYAALEGYALDTISTPSFIDIETSGVSAGNFNSNTIQTVATPSFKFNNNLVVNNLAISSIGLAIVDYTVISVNPINTNLPTTLVSGQKFLSPYWDDLLFQANSSITTKTVGSSFIIQFSHLSHTGFTGGDITFQIQIDTITNRISYVYPDVVFGNPSIDNGNSATVGIQWSSTEAMTYSFNSSQLSNGKSISFIPTANLLMYQWSGPNLFSSNQQFPILNSTNASSVGTYSVTITSPQGCSSSTTTSLVINPATLLTPDIITTCEQYVWPVNNHTYTNSGTYYDTTNCVIRTLVLQLIHGIQIHDTVQSCDNYTWAINGTTYTLSGDYFNITSGICDTNYLHLTILPSTNSTNSISVCDSYTWPLNGVTYTQSGTYQFNANCQVTNLILNIANGVKTILNMDACDTYTWVTNGMTYTNSGIYNFTTNNSSGCVDTLSLQLVIHQSSLHVSTISQVGTYTWPINGITYTASGTYSFTSLNASNCMHTEELHLTILQQQSLLLNVIEDQSISCHGNADGSLQATAISPSSTTVVYTIQHPTLPSESNNTGFFHHLEPGTHTVCASDGAFVECMNITFVEPDPLDIVFHTDSVVSCLGSDGALSISISGGTNVLQNYLTWWTNTNGDTLNNVITNNFALNLITLNAGIYQVTVEDDHGCFYSESYLLQQSNPMTIAASAIPISCYNGTTSISVNISGGVTYSPYTIMVNNMPQLSNYIAGSYTVSASDAKGCNATTVVQILQPPLITNASSITACNSYSWNGVTYTQSGIYVATFVASNGCDSIHTLTLNFNQGIRISPKVLLSGAYMGNGLMYDSLRINAQIPLIEPYTSLNFIPIGNLGGETTTSAILNMAGLNAIVDWVHIELRTGAPAYAKVATQNALLQRDGDVVDASGNTLYFPNVCPGNYYVSIKHRNHLGVMSSMMYALQSSSQLIDFTIPNSTWVKAGVTNTPQKTIGAYSMLWMGDTRVDKNSKYNGLSNDKEPILNSVGLATPNNLIYPVYRTEDVNMDARVKYNNTNNDKNILLNEILLSNPILQSTNAVINQHTPN